MTSLLKSFRKLTRPSQTTLRGSGARFFGATATGSGPLGAHRSVPLPLDPDLAALPDLPLPDRDPLLEGIDREAAGLERLAPVRAGRDHQHARLPDLQPADPVLHRDPPAPPPHGLLPDRPHLPLRHR